jgi:hypothetical protein
MTATEPPLAQGIEEALEVVATLQRQLLKLQRQAQNVPLPLPVPPEDEASTSNATAPGGAAAEADDDDSRQQQKSTSSRVLAMWGNSGGPTLSSSTDPSVQHASPTATSSFGKKALSQTSSEAQIATQGLQRSHPETGRTIRPSKDPADEVADAPGGGKTDGVREPLAMDLLFKSRCRELYMHVDRDGDGSLSHAELVQAVTLWMPHAIQERSVEEMFAEADANGSGRINLDEFVAMMSNEFGHKLSTLDQLRQARRRPSVRPSVRSSVRPAARPSVRLSVRPSIRPC